MTERAIGSRHSPQDRSPFCIACYTGTLVGFAVYAANGNQFSLNLAIALTAVGVDGALLAALPGFADWAFGIPRDSAAKTVGLAHAGLNVAALVLFAIGLGTYATHGNGPATGATRGFSPRPDWPAPSPPASWAGRSCRTTTSACASAQNTKVIGLHHKRAACPPAP